MFEKWIQASKTASLFFYSITFYFQLFYFFFYVSSSSSLSLALHIEYCWWCLVFFSICTTFYCDIDVTNGDFVGVRMNCVTSLMFISSTSWFILCYCCCFYCNQHHQHHQYHDHESHGDDDDASARIDHFTINSIPREKRKMMTEKLIDFD